MAAASRQSATIAAAIGLAPFARPTSIPAPRDNPLTRAKIALGRALFNDPALSESGTRSCASCHYPIQSFTDGLVKARAFGKELERNTPALWNLAWSTALFWDARAASLEAQARVPLSRVDEMGHSPEAAAARVAARPGYVAAFAVAFPDGPRIDAGTLARALATYERSLVSPATRFDRFVEGDSAALTPREQRGFALFTGAGGCVACHAGFAFTDSRAHQLGASDADLGRAAVTGLASDAHAFRTPSLRELTYTAPYLHDGAAATLDDALRAHGGEAAAGVAALGGEDSAAVLGFLRTLSSEAAPVAAPPLDAAGEIVSHAAE